MRTSLSFGISAALLLAAVGCGSSLPTQSTEMTSAVIGPTGGMAASSDGALQVAIPAGALASDVTVTIVPTTPPGTGSVGTVYEIGPTGTQFAIPVTLTFDYGATNLAGNALSLLRVATYATGSWEILSGASRDMQAQTVSGKTMHLSPYGLVSAPTGAMCAGVSGGVTCSGSASGSSTGSGGTSASSGGTTGAAAASGSTSSGDPVCTPSTCAEATNACAAYPGATMSSCTDGPNGYQATCCFPSGGSICLAAPVVGGGCSEACSVDGSCTTTCPPAPTCSTATTAAVCGGLPGATLQDCVDGANGYTAACCFAPGAPVCTTVAAGGGCGGGGTTTSGSATSGAGGTTDCPGIPHCANSDPCAGIAGATMQSCTDSADGYSAVCCLPLGEVPSAGGGGQVVSGGSGVGGAGGVDTGTAGVSGTGTGTGSGAAGGTTTSTTGGGGAGGIDTGAGGTTGSGTGIGGASGTDGASTGVGGTTGSGGSTTGAAGGTTGSGAASGATGSGGVGAFA